MGRGEKLEQQKTHPQTAFSLSFDPTLPNEPRLQTSKSNANRSPPQRWLLSQPSQNMRTPPKTSKTRKSSALPHPAIPHITRQSSAGETNSNPPRISLNLRTPSERGSKQSERGTEKSYRDQTGRSLRGNPSSFLVSQSHPQSQENPPHRNSLKAKKSSSSALPRLPNLRPKQQTLSQQTLKKQQWRLPARTTQGWVNTKKT